MTGAFGKLFKELRIRHGKTLRQLCLENGFQPANVSRIERGLLPPPRSTEKLTKYAEAVGIQAGTDEWLEFFDLAAVEAGRLPKDVLEDKELVGKLPVLFRTILNRKIDENTLDELVERIRRA